jgi:hypothetical protein
MDHVETVGNRGLRKRCGKSGDLRRRDRAERTTRVRHGPEKQSLPGGQPLRWRRREKKNGVAGCDKMVGQRGRHGAAPSDGRKANDSDTHALFRQSDQGNTS